MVSCVGHPPLAGTSQRLLRPLMLETKAICLPSGDHVVPAMLRVVQSFSMEKACMFSMVLLWSLAGSVMGCWDNKGTVNTNQSAETKRPTRAKEARMGHPTILGVQT